MSVGMLLALSETWMVDWLSQAFYPLLLAIFVIASLGIPIPEDIPLIAAGIILKTNPEIASWGPTIFVSLVGIMSGDVILYSLGRRWGPKVFEHKSVRWLMTPARMKSMTERFHRWGVWMCFFGRFMVGVRAVMCMTAGVTRFPFWKFFLADFSGALLSAPLFILLGYKCAEMLHELEKYMDGAKWILLSLGAIVAVGIVWYEIRRAKKTRDEFQSQAAVAAEAAADAVASGLDGQSESHAAEPTEPAVSRKKPNAVVGPKPAS